MSVKSSENVSETEFVFYDENDEDFRNFRAYCEETRPKLHHWTKTAELSLVPNQEQLAEEMWATLQHLSSFMREIELKAKSRRLKKLNNKTGDWTKWCREGGEFLESLHYGRDSMRCLVKALEMGPLPFDLSLPTYMSPSLLYRRISKFEDSYKGRTARDKILELGTCLREVVGRFARICETEGVQHDMPVISPPETTVDINILSRMKKRIKREPVPTEKPVQEVQKEPESNNIVYDFGDHPAPESPIVDTCSLLPCDFMEEYCRRDRSVVYYEDMGKVGKANLNQELVVVCKVRNMAGEGKGKKKSTAQQYAAAMLIKTLLTRQKQGKMATDARLLSEQERLLAIRVMSEFLDFEKELMKISNEEYHRLPFFTPMVNTSGNHVRCKALGYNTIGYGRTKEVARRMAAKLILDMYKEAKEVEKKKNKLKYQVSKCLTVADKSS